MGRKKKIKVKIKVTPIVLTILVVIIGAVFLCYYLGLFDSVIDRFKQNNNSKPHQTDVLEFADGALTISFLELGNKYTGDSVYIKADDIDILIDAGSRNSSSSAIAEYMDQYVTDGKLEYVIATHAHQDHIAGFVGTNVNPGIFARYECETIIDFALHNTTSKVYNDYVTARDKEVEAGAKHYTALECWNNENGAKRSYQLTSDIKMDILYNYYYEHSTDDENDYSVCVLFTHGDRKFLFTGDLEASGESYLVQYNDLPEVNLFKAGHHGSYTASTDKLLDVIKPKVVCVCCCCGSDEYTSNINNMFPSQAFVDRVFKHTKEVYVTTIVSDDAAGFKSMNGTIVVSSTKDDIKITCSNNNTWFIDTEWFKEHRKWIE